MALGPNPILARELRTQVETVINLTGVETVNWINMHVFCFGPEWNAVERDSVAVFLESSINGNDWMQLSQLGSFTGPQNTSLRSVLGNQVLEHLPPFLRLRIVKGNETGREALPYELLVLAHAG